MDILSNLYLSTYLPIYLSIYLYIYKYILIYIYYSLNIPMKFGEISWFFPRHVNAQSTKQQSQHMLLQKKEQNCWETLQMLHGDAYFLGRTDEQTQLKTVIIYISAYIYIALYTCI